MEKRTVNRRLGCILILPAALIGLAGLTDGAGPTGWRGFAELVGWTAVCGGLAAAIAGLLSRGKYGALRYTLPAFALLLAGSITSLINWLASGAPMTAKIAFTTSLQVIGTAFAALLVAGLGYLVWDMRRRE